ncbi:hypothetical protein J3P96_04110 [Pseudomonas sp. R3-56]
MRASNWVITTLALTIFSVASAMAGPAVTVTFKNLGTKDATYTVANNNEASTRNNSNPTPTPSVKADQSNTYKVQSRTSPDANFASLRYKMGSKECVYSTTFVATAGPGGSKIPRWKESATPGGGAICTITVLSRDFRTYEWAVQITMK